MQVLERLTDGATTRQIIERFPELKIRTTRRDLKELDQAGFKLCYTEDGRWRVVAPMLKSLPIKTSQIIALGVAARMLTVCAQSLAEPIRELKRLLSAKLDDKCLEYCQQSEASFAVPLVERNCAPNELEHIETFREALEEEQPLEMQYKGRRGVKNTYVVEPHGVYFANQRTYLVAWSDDKESYVPFVAHRVRDLDVLDDEFEPRLDFDLDDIVTNNLGGYGGPMYDYVLELSKNLAYMAEEHIFHPDQVLTPLEDGKTRVSFRARGLPVLAAQIASYAGQIVPIGPPELIEEVRSIHRAGLEAL